MNYKKLLYSVMILGSLSTSVVSSSIALADTTDGTDKTPTTTATTTQSSSDLRAVPEIPTIDSSAPKEAPQTTKDSKEQSTTATTQAAQEKQDHEVEETKTTQEKQDQTTSKTQPAEQAPKAKQEEKDTPDEGTLVPDANLKAALETKCGGTITKEKLAQITELNVDNLGIASIEGLQYCTALQKLVIGQNRPTTDEETNTISDLKPLSQLKNLTILQAGGLRIVDFTPLAPIYSQLQFYIGIESYLGNQNIRLRDTTDDGSYKLTNTFKDIDGSPLTILDKNKDEGVYADNTLSWDNVATGHNGSGSGGDGDMTWEIQPQFTSSVVPNSGPGVFVTMFITVHVKKMVTSLFADAQETALAPNVTQKQIDKAKEQVETVDDATTKQTLLDSVNKAQKLLDQGSTQPTTQHTVTFKTDGNGTLSFSTATVNDGESLTDKQIPIITANEGYVFNSWQDSQGKTVSDLNSATITQDCTYTAIFRKTEVNVADWVTDTSTPGVIKITGYNGNAKEVVVPTAKDFGDEGKEVRITKDAMNYAAKEANAQSGTISISTDGPKVIADGADWSWAFSTDIFGPYLTNINSIDLRNLDTSSVTNMYCMFNSCRGLTSLNLDNLDTRKVTNMSFMFGDCRGLTSLNIDNLDTSSVTNMCGMFSTCYGLKDLNFGDKFDTRKVTDMSFMFMSCRGLTSLNLDNLDTRKVTDMSLMFENCRGLTSLNLDKFDTRKVTDMSEMFWDCSGLTSLNLDKFDTSSVTDMSSMFYYCSGLTSLNLDKFDTSSVTDMSSMFVTYFQTPLLVHTADENLKHYDYAADNRTPLGAVNNGNDGYFDNTPSTTETTLFSSCVTNQPIDEALLANQLKKRQEELTASTSADYVFQSWKPEKNYTTLAEKLNGSYTAQWEKKELKDTSILPMSLDFGTSTIQYEQDQTLTAREKDGSDTTGKLDITDTRSADGEGFHVKVEQDHALKGKTTGKELTKSAISFQTGAATNTNHKTITGGNQTVALTPGKEVTVLSAAKGQSRGETTMPLSNFKLKIPKDEHKTKDTYEATVTWTLSDAP
ncbi:BspA family leucine-rich repeat surface protein [Enterococcus canintestini]|uniref:BspA family leucine-rich repeat surface protein n=1 Tax=Enterococcus canintestini TaxID=317010 RepID=UPI000BA23DC1|nr:BspA family leucine-rich repeat surface protein [Enterococcus canintestini]